MRGLAIRLRTSELVHCGPVMESGAGGLGNRFGKTPGQRPEIALASNTACTQPQGARQALAQASSTLTPAPPPAPFFGLAKLAIDLSPSARRGWCRTFLLISDLPGAGNTWYTK